jgi:bifunctional non-homologous end joining protein LigD
MLARSGPIPTRGDYAFEVKWDGFRALVSTRPFRVLSRRGWDMTPMLGEFADLRPHGVYDAELVAFGDDGKPDFPAVCQRLLNRDSTIPLALIVFDVLAYRGRSLIGEPYRRRREVLDRIDFRGRAHAPEALGDGAALFDAVCEHELEGVVAKRLNEPYRPGERAWVKTKNRSYWRYELEREGALMLRRPRQRVISARAGGSPHHRPGPSHYHLNSAGSRSGTASEARMRTDAAHRPA